MNLLERAASVLKATTAGRRPSVGSSLGNLAPGFDLGTKALRKSWEGSAESKGRDNLNPRPAKAEKKSEIRSSSVQRKSISGDRQVAKEENISQSPLKKGYTNGALESTDTSSIKPRISTFKKIQDVTNASTISVGNLVKVSSNFKRWTDGSVSWTSLPPCLIKLGKEVLRYRDAAQQAAVEALQEASAAESLVRCLSMYSELTATAKEDNPQQAVEQFLSLHSSLAQAGLVSNSLLKTAACGLCRCSSPDHSLSSPPPIPEEAIQISSDVRRRSAAWVSAALTTDLHPPSLYSHKSNVSSSSSKPPQAVVVLDNPPKTTIAAKGTSASQAKPRSPAKPSAKQRGTVASAPPPAIHWEQGKGLEEGVELARTLGEEGKKWFVGFVERFLDAEAGGPERLPWDRDAIAGMLSQLKKVNDWLDEAGRGDGMEKEGGDSIGVAVSTLPPETVDRLRKKIYEYLLTHVESAAVALGSGGNSVGISTPTALGVGRKS
ncbi:hypothetical protein HPP92_005594 [Vanilla planifolia]|nr:hypothetical protein HPP92_005594 [Vanilla planifolia]